MVDVQKHNYMAKMDTDNIQGVGVKGDNIVILFPKTSMTVSEALVHAAWLVAVTGESSYNFTTLLESIQSK